MVGGGGGGHRFREVVDGKVNESCVLLVFT